jgi:hypothetical protein
MARSTEASDGASEEEMLTPTVTELARISAHRYDIAPRVPRGASGSGAPGGKLLAKVTTRRVVASAPLPHGAPVR